ncbi:hypothetical protein AUEXF2481DRAFT_48759 [Aureobasidium subglaciale EXF-2481]|uniref:Zn(2)-C6 fungal-type domain-containing protein n=1 Tax=Aureobasidium subglaciale (strain EXF-2481) TaxID=1043005 RepID=A0A074XXV1_AURSE|nr:uncharacterized protein AUEXF2481DRAFT_48759 [Aureobasidium subglaciale EXF-2481]KEQ90403.1 hypothetical protein AUEXF2481DRAFT_48759 [Aureobasidium subglaciale EXF-2481]
MQTSNQGRPYRSHLKPACHACRRRKSRCTTTESSAACLMCQVHGSPCVFVDDDQTRRRKVPPPRGRAIGHADDTENNIDQPDYSTSLSISQPTHVSDTALLQDRAHQRIPVALVDPASQRSSTVSRPSEEASMSAMLAASGDSSPHIISPAMVDDNQELDSYLSNGSAVGIRKITRASSTNASMGSPSRHVLFNTVLRKPLGIQARQSVADGKLEVIEKLLEPHLVDLVDLFFEHANVCFPILDEISFRRTYSEHKDRLSAALLANLYANAMTYWNNSPRLRPCHSPDHRYLWVQANEALHSELFLSPGISTVISIILNVHGRPSTSMFGNGGMVGTAVALSNSLGLNRDCSAWDISPGEKALRSRIWSTVVLMDRWTSLAYGTPLLVHRTQYDVPVPSTELLAYYPVSSIQLAGLSVFTALLTLTDVLSQYLEHMYRISRSAANDRSPTSPFNLESLLLDWEDTLPDDIRRLVIRGNDLGRAGAGNLRLSYLAVKLLLRRILRDATNLPPDHESVVQARIQTQRVAEEIVLHVQELQRPHLRGFWMPTNGFTLTSATLFLLRDALKVTNRTSNTSLKLAKDMIAGLQTHRNNEAWDLADDCLANCTDMTDIITARMNRESPGITDAQTHLDNDFLMFNDVTLSYPSAFDFDLEDFQLDESTYQ